MLAVKIVAGELRIVVGHYYFHHLRCNAVTIVPSIRQTRRLLLESKTKG